ncbi:MAG: hypothetical protein ACD_36C00124G0003 [uncultured bacterium]|nr:MAG: hypothetical protein ACD_36C00124G0003 [uncultured bacterium]
MKKAIIYFLLFLLYAGVVFGAYLFTFGRQEPFLATLRVYGLRQGLAPVLFLSHWLAVR